MAKFNVRTPSGFPEFSPAQERVRQQWIAVITEVFEKYGFMPIITPLVEREENLLGKGGNPKEMYVLKRLHAEGDEDSGNALRFDHTVPLALYVARHLNDLSFPFKRYAIGPVMRGERAQKGRYRQFDQCDIDIVGNGELDIRNDALVAAVIIEIFEKLNIGDFVVRINNRKLVIGLFEELLGIKDAEEIKAVMDVFDDLEKASKADITKRLVGLGLKEDQVGEIYGFVEGDNFEALAEKCSENGLFAEGWKELTTVFDTLKSMGIDAKRYRHDFSIVRGLDYYTGTVYETQLIEYPGLGSICSGGRYEDLTGIFTGKNFPGVGISIGLTRLLGQLFAEGIIDPVQASPASYLLVTADDGSEVLDHAFKVAQILREKGASVDVYLEDKKLGKKFDYADKLGIPNVVVIGDQEVEKNCFTVKDMKSGEQKVVKL